MLFGEAVRVSSWGRRRVPGLRREALARIAGISVNYYTRLEQGQSSNASDAITEALAWALDLNDDERRHLRELARPVPAPRKRLARAEVAVPGALAPVASMPSVPALLLGRRNDVLVWNPLGHALVAERLAFADPDVPATRPEPDAPAVSRAAHALAAPRLGGRGGVGAAVCGGAVSG